MKAIAKYDRVCCKEQVSCRISADFLIFILTAGFVYFLLAQFVEKIVVTMLF